MYLDLSLANIIELLTYIVIIGLMAVGFYYFKGKFASAELYGLNKAQIKKRWEQIEELMARKDDMSRKLAVMEADKLLDHVLKAMFFPGSTLGDRLKYACDKYRDLRQVWWAHKIRNQIVHEANYHLNYYTSKRAIDIFKKSFKLLKVL